MIVFPAIDLQNGQCVRLTKGDFASTTVYNPDPLEQATIFADAGASWLHVVDLDGARDGTSRQSTIIRDLAQKTPLKLQVGGGIRSSEVLQELLNAGVERVVIGSLAVQDPELVRQWIQTFGPDKIVLALDVNFTEDVPFVVTHGWQETSPQTLWDVLDTYATSGLTHILCTDVGRDGTLEGTNIALYQTLRQRAPSLEVLASGGVCGADDLTALANIPVAGVVVGKALYEKRLDLASLFGKTAPC